MLKLIDISKIYNGNVVLRGVNLEAEGFVGIYGPNGSGKSTLLKIVAGIEKPDCGRVIFEEEDITGMKAENVAKKGITMVFQIPRPFRNLNVLKNIAVASLLRKSYKEALDLASKICESVGLDYLKYEKAGELSQGELRLLEIGRALAMQPKLILLDEPFSGLDVENVRRVVRILKKIKAEGVEAIITAHRTKLLEEIADKSYEIRGGKIVEV